MSDNGSGTYVVNSSGQPVVAETPITAAVHNALTADLATALSNRICKDGQTTPTANIPFGGYKATGLGAATARTDGASIATIQDGTGVYVGTVGGTADAITLTPSPAIAAYATGQTFRFLASGANTTNVAVAISGLAAKALVKYGSTALQPGEIITGQLVTITYDGTRFVMENTPAIITTWTPSIGGTATYTQRSGTYLKIGRLVFIHLRLLINAIGTGSTNTISGLPFPGATGFSFQALSVGNFSGLASTVVSMNPVIDTASSSIIVYAQTAASAGIAGNAVFQNSAEMTITGVYLTD